MFLRNWYKALTAEMSNSQSVTGINTSGTANYFTPYSSTGGVANNTRLVMAGGTPSSNDYTPHMQNVRTSYYQGGVVFGTGDTAPTFDDYKLSGSIVTAINAGASVETTFDDDGCTFVGTYNISNTGSEEITIKEVGLILRSAYNNSAILVERTVLDTPLTIPAGGIGQVVYTIRMDYPTA